MNQMPLWMQILTLAPISANALLSIRDLVQTFPIDIFALAHDMGIEVELTDDDEMGALVLEGTKATIRMSKKIAHSRQRFTVAYEIGRLALGPCTDPVANRFAAELLMPEDRMRIVAQALSSVHEMASYFDVSTDAIIYRLKILGIVDP